LSRHAKIRDDSDSERQFAEISLSAVRKIGEISRDLEKAESHGGKVWLPIAGKSKEQQLSWHLHEHWPGVMSSWLDHAKSSRWSRQYGG
jgi:hypothetical protein